jgi:hypothetical protein
LKGKSETLNIKRDGKVTTDDKGKSLGDGFIFPEGGLSWFCPTLLLFTECVLGQQPEVEVNTDFHSSSLPLPGLSFKSNPGSTHVGYGMQDLNFTGT